MFRKAIENVLKSHEADNASFLAYFLHSLSHFYAAAVKARLAGYRSGIFPTRELPCKVISIGNLAVGGTGKTPLTVYVAELIHRWGLRGAVISRGYKGQEQQRGAIVGDGRQLLLSPQAAGDEPFLMAARLKERSVPVLVGQDRIAIAQLAIREFAPDVIILDDGFQHVRLARNVDVVLLDGQRPFGNGHMLPRGVLREPLSSLHRADLFVLTRTDEAQTTGTAAKGSAMPFGLPHRPIFRSAHMPMLRAWIRPGHNERTELLNFPGTGELHRLAGQRVFAFSGIADNGAFRRSLVGLGIDVKGFIGFADHHAYAAADIDRILNSARSVGAGCLCTTDKDWVKLSQRLSWPVELAVMGVDVDFGDDAHRFETELRSRLITEG